MGLFACNPDGGATVAATGSSVAGTITATGCNALRITNTSATLNVAVEWGTAAVTAVLATHLKLAPLESIIVAIPPTIAHVAAIGSAAGPTDVSFMPGIWND